MNPYSMLGSSIGTTDAASLGVRLTAWHDAMVAHERRLRTGLADDACNDECPHAEARTLWSEAVAAFGRRASELTFLRSRAVGHSRRSNRGDATADAGLDVVDTEDGSSRTGDTPTRISPLASREELGAAEL